MPILMIISLILYAVIIFCAYKDLKKTIIIWTPLSLLFNAQVSVLYHPQAISLTVAVNLSLVLSYIFFRRNNTKRYNRENFPLTIYMILTIGSYLISSLFSVIPFSFSFNNIVKTIVQNFGIIYLFFKCIKNNSDIRLFLKTSAIVAILICFDGLIENITHINIVGDFIYETSPHDISLRGRSYYIPYYITHSSVTRFGLSRCFSFFSIHIAFGVACVCLFFLFGVVLRNKWLVFENKNTKYNMNFIRTCLFLLIIGIICSNSKTPILGFAIILFSFFTFRQFLDFKLIIPAIVILSLLIIYTRFFDNFISLTDSQLAEEEGGSTVATRADQLKYILKLFEQSPIIGNGINAARYFSRNIYGFEAILGAESIWFTLLADQGVVGCLIYIYGFFACTKMCNDIIPRKVYIPLLVSIFVMETATGGLNMILYFSILIVIRKKYMLSKRSTNQLYTTVTR